MSLTTCRLVCYIDSLGYYIGDVERVATIVKRPPVDVVRTAQWAVDSPQDAIVLIRAARQQNLWSGLRLLAQKRRQQDPIEPIEQEIFLLMPCGYGAHFMAFDDIPASSLRCPCGDPNHWLIRYQAPEVLPLPPL